MRKPWIPGLVVVVCMLFFYGCVPKENQGYVGICYNAFDAGQQGELSHISIQEKGEVIAVEFVREGEAFHMEYVEKEEGQYEYFYKMGEKEFYSIFFKAESDYSGMVRDLSNPVDTETQFGFLISTSQERLEEYWEQVQKQQKL